VIKTKIKITIKKEIDLPEIIITNLDDLSDETLNQILIEIKEQIKHYFTQPILIRERYGLEGRQDCPFCKGIFKNVRALKTHISRSHKLQKEKGNLFLSAHKVSTKINNFIYFILENNADDSHQTIFKLQFKK